MATRKRTTKKAAPKRSNSNIAAVQRESAVKRQARIAADQARRDRGEQKPQAALPPGMVVPKLEPRTNTPMANSGRGVDQDSIAKRDNKSGADIFKGGSEAANKIAGLASGIMQQHQEQGLAERKKLANPALYGASGKDRATRLTALMAAQNQVRNQALVKAGNAVYMGPKIANAKVRNLGPQRQDENGNDTSQIGPVGDQIVTKDELMSWLADETNFNKIKTAANKAGIAVESYDDVAKVWASVVNQAAATYSTTGKKVTPWALLQLRGKTMKDGKPASKTTISTSIDEMDPAQAKLMIRNAASQALGRDPTKEEIEDFISKAQTIAARNPNVTTTTTNYGFDGEPVSQASYSKGGGDAVTAQAQEAALEQSKQSEDYTAYQAAGVYMPWLMDALASPI